MTTVVLVDMDNVVADLDRRFREVWAAALSLVEGAREALAEMDAHGYRVHICTSPLSTRSPNAAEKLDWIEDNLGARWRHGTIITKDKTMVRGDVLVDDAITVTGAMVPAWRHVVFSRPFNLDASVAARMTWSTWREVIESGGERA